MQRTILVRNNTGLASGVAIVADADSVVVGFQAVTANAIFTTGSLSVADLVTPTAFNFTNDLVVFGLGGFSAMIPTKIPISKGETYYVRFSGNGSAVLYLDDSLVGSS
jgi:hypothetical protein